ncbi:MAG: hypothetical protein IT376_05665 [Polyangiaceae bacterium]|nr:hypothetical protein [Polyangiaceae bacterium]
MSSTLVLSLDPIRTDGWFERVGEGIGSFQALCDIVGSRFFAFAMIAGARITALTVDRRNPDNTLVDFVVGGPETESTPEDTQRLTLADFRRRLVAALVADDPPGPPPTRPTDLEALQLHVGVRYLLLAPIYGYSLGELAIEPERSVIRVVHDGIEKTFSLEQFRARLRTHVREELDRAARGARGSIDLARVAEAERAAERGDHVRILELLGAWPAPLAIYLRTPDGQGLAAEARAVIARGLGLLGSACVALAEVEKGEEVLRLAVQYAGDGPASHDIYARLGRAMLADERAGEAIGPLRRALRLGGPEAELWPLLAEAFVRRSRGLAALGAVAEARAAGAPDAAVEPWEARIAERLGPALQRWRALVERAD